MSDRTGLVLVAVCVVLVAVGVALGHGAYWWTLGFLCGLAFAVVLGTILGRRKRRRAYLDENLTQ